MKRVARILYRLLTALSLLLLLASAGVWVRSYWVSDALNWYDWPEDHSFLDSKFTWCWRGGIKLVATRCLSGNIRMPDGAHFQHYRFPTVKQPAYGDGLNAFFSPKSRRYAALGFEWIPETATWWNSPINSDVRVQSLTLPLYFPCLLFALLPAHYFFRLRRRRRIAKRLALGCCIACGYDLRATPGRCPECGREGPAVSIPG